MLAALRLLRWRFAHPDLDRVRQDVIRRAEADPRFAHDADLRDAVALLKRHPLRHALYPAKPPPRIRASHVQWDAEEQLHYVLHGGRRLYWRDGVDAKTIARHYAGLLLEQEDDSPHRYCLGAFHVELGDVVADIGAAEGIFALGVIEQASHVHLFEADAGWLKALRATFRPWQEKVSIHQVLVGRRGQAGTVALDDVLRDHRAPDFYKLDVEGSEGDVIAGAQATFARTANPRLAVCAYHREEDEANLTAQLRRLGFQVETARGWVLLYRTRDWGEPYVRRGVLRAWRA